jgi:copper(I)-binding protein
MSMPSSRRSSHKVAALGAALAVAVLAGCGTASTAAPSSATPTISNAWLRPPTAPGSPAAVYMTITNSGGTADALVGISSPAAMSVELHETSIDSSGMTGMHPIERLEIPAGGSVTLEPGGYHLMLMGVTELIAGSAVELSLEFEQAGTVTVQVQAPQG